MPTSRHVRLRFELRLPSIASIRRHRSSTSGHRSARSPRSAGRRARDHRRRQGQRLRPRRARGGAARSSRPARRCWRAPTSRRASCCARPACASPILVFGALERQRSRRRVQLRPDADDLDAVRRRARCRRPPRGTADDACSCHLKIDTGMNRLGFRHDNLARTLPEVAASPQPRDRRRLHALRHRRRARAPGLRRAARALRRGLRGAAGARHHVRGTGTPPTARRCCATSGSGTTSSGPACCSTASCRRRSPRRCRCDLPCHSIAVSWP